MSDPEAPVKRPESWQPLIRNARSVQTVLDVLRDHLSSWAPGELEQLPPDCRPPEISDVEDVSYWAVHLTQRELRFDGEAEAAERLRELASMFVQAGNKITQVFLESRNLGPSTDSKS
jgi:hypothetical protein